MTRRTRLVGACLAAAALAAIAGAGGVGAGAVGAPAAPPSPDEVPPPDHRVYFVTESVGLGAKSALPLAFPADWQVTVDGTPALFVEQMESKHVRTRLVTSPWVFGDIAVVAGGHNYPYWDPARFDRSIDSMMAALREAGAEHIFWVTLREVKPQYISPSAWREVQPYYWYFPIVNDHLESALQRHPDLTLIDWTAAADRPGLTYDAIHLNTTGAALYSQLVADTVMTSVRRAPAGAVTRVAAAGGDLGVDPAAVAVNLTVTSPRVAGFLTAYGCDGGPPLVSNANYVRDQVVASAAIVPVGSDGSICVISNADTHVIVDVGGAFPAGGGFVPVTPERLVDTREIPGGTRLPGGAVLRVPVAGERGVPADAAAVAVTVTATDPAAEGFATVTPCGTPPPGTSTVNFGLGATVPNLTVVEPGDDGSICVTSNVATHLVVDVFGAFAAGADLGLVGPERVVDTRQEPDRRPGAGGGTVVLHLGERPDVADGARGVMLNVTSVAPAAAGFLTAYPCNQGRPNASNLNVVAGVNRANFVIVAPDSAGDVCVFSSTAGDVVVDLIGWLGGAFDGITPTRLADTR